MFTYSGTKIYEAPKPCLSLIRHVQCLTNPLIDLLWLLVELQCVEVPNTGTKKLGRPRGRPTKKAPRQLQTSDGDSSDGQYWSVEEESDPESLADEDEEPSEEPSELKFNQRHAGGCPPFEGAGVGKSNLEKFDDMNPYQIFMWLFRGVLEKTVASTNLRLEAKTSLGEVLLFIAVFMLMAMVRLPRMDQYWYPGPGLSKWVTTMDLKSKMPARRFKDIKAALCFEDQERCPEEKKEGDRAWKVRGIWTLFAERSKQILAAPGKWLALDEGMIKFMCTRNPLLELNPRKPIKQGMKIFGLVCSVTKILINVMLADKVITAENSKEFPAGATGRVVTGLTDWLPGRWYHLFLDNWYATMRLGLLLKTQCILMIGTLRKNRVPCPELVRAFGASKDPKPSVANPRGKHCFASNEDATVHLVMDNKAVFFYDSAYHNDTETVYRTVNKVQQRFQGMPKVMAEYTNHKGGCDVFDQLRGADQFAIEQVGRQHKWTVTLWLAMVSMASTNAYCIYRALHAYETEGYLTHNNFQLSLLNSLWNNPLLTQGRPGGRPTTDAHQLMETKAASRGEEHGNRRKCGTCRECSGSYQTTTWYCATCQVFLHPDCFQAWHDNPSGSKNKTANAWLKANA